MNKIKLFVALDKSSNKENIEIVKKLSKYVYGFKVGYRAFYNDKSLQLIKIIKKNSKLFLDLKLHDIPNTTTNALESLNSINPEFLTVHISGGESMLTNTINFVKKKKLKTKILGVTLLTSLDQKDISTLYGKIEINDILRRFIKLANKCNLDGIICSAQDLPIFNKYKELIKVTPGVKLFNRSQDDQKRISSAVEAFKKGADYVVVGREIINHKNPIIALQSYYEDHKDKNMWTA